VCVSIWKPRSRPDGHQMGLLQFHHEASKMVENLEKSLLPTTPNRLPPGAALSKSAGQHNEPPPFRFRLWPWRFGGRQNAICENKHGPSYQRSRLSERRNPLVAQQGFCAILMSWIGIWPSPVVGSKPLDPSESAPRNTRRTQERRSASPCPLLPVTVPTTPLFPARAGWGGRSSR
jgi:hypothetical protein